MSEEKIISGELVDFPLFKLQLYENEFCCMNYLFYKFI